mmetsp:Transcript_18075/g.54511  ORF Transcript_18075/g.54511 Transcript_18075/m.54511 type:complete len:432 (-) Transcript_18075:2104-3399(-)
MRSVRPAPGPTSHGKAHAEARKPRGARDDLFLLHRRVARLPAGVPPAQLLLGQVSLLVRDQHRLRTWDLPPLCMSRARTGARGGLTAGGRLPGSGGGAWASDVPEDAFAATEAALGVEAVCPTTEDAHLAVRLPVARHLGLAAPGGELTPVLRRVIRLRARDVLEGPLRAEAALRVHPVGHATQHAHVAGRVPVVRRRGFHGEGALLRRWALGAGYVGVVALAAEAAAHVHRISEAALHAMPATWVHKEWRCGQHVKSAGGRARPGGWRGRRLRAGYVGVGVLPTEAALRVNAIRPTALHPRMAGLIPVVWHKGLVHEGAAGVGARDAAVGASPTETALNVDTVCVATQHSRLARGVPEETWEERHEVELTAADRPSGLSGYGGEAHGGRRGRCYPSSCIRSGSQRGRRWPLRAGRTLRRHGKCCCRRIRV